ncbi:MAG: Glycosyl transferase, group 2 family [Firmicutes bacterium]|nr:Glycosyl transferase, group 2 family [Bacillota bacterium]
MLSLCMIVKNEEKTLARCLESVNDIVDEMIIVDTGSTDSTVAVARSYGAKVLFYKWDDSFSAARNYSLKHATGDWILIMDADDELEQSDKPKLLELMTNKNVDVYLLQTLNYVGNKPGLDVVCNLNVRLIRNCRGYRFEGEIHEQITNENPDFSKGRIRSERVKFHHHGYLHQNVIEKNKRSRNIRILQKVLEDNPDDAFTLFNVGNEFTALDNHIKALEYYGRAYSNFHPDTGYGPRLFFRMALSMNALGLYEEELKIINEGLEYYPDFTDLEYLKASLFHHQDKFTLAIRAYKKCLSMGEPPLYQSFILGAGNFRAHHALSEIYFELGDYNASYNHCVEAIRMNPDFTLPLNRIAQVLDKKGVKMDVIKSKLENFFEAIPDRTPFITLERVFSGLKRHDIALEYLLRAEKTDRDSADILYRKGMCLLYLKEFDRAVECFDSVKPGEFYEMARFRIALCEALKGNMYKASQLLEKTNEYKDDDTRTVYKTFVEILEGKKCEPINSNREESGRFVNIIFDLLSIVLTAGPPETFEKSLQLLNLIENDEVLLRLAKLYYSNGYYSLAYQEFMRSIKMFGKIDREGIKMLNKIFILPRRIMVSEVKDNGANNNSTSCG